jgi:hypothetical protein
MNEPNFESLKNQMDSFEGVKDKVLSKYEKLGDEKDRMKVINIEGDIIYEVIPELEKRREIIEKRIINNQEKVEKATDSKSRDVALFYLEFAKNDKEKIDKEIKKFQDILEALKK